MSRRAATLSLASVLVLVLALIGSVMQVPYVALMPGPTSNTLGTNDKGQPLIRIDGRKTYPDEGHLNFTTVTYRGGPGGRIDLLTALRGWIKGDTAIVPEETIFPKDESPKQVDEENTRQMQDSQQNAEAAALHELHIPVATRVVIDGIQKGRPADGVLKTGDEITALDGQKITSVSQITGTMAKHKIGDSITLTYLRGGKEQRARIRPHGLVEAESCVIERRGLLQAADVQVHVADCGAGRQALPVKVARSGRETLHIQRLGCHHQFTIALTPGASRPVGVDLDAEAIRIPQVQRFAHEVIGHPRTHAEIPQVSDELPEGGPLGQKHGEVIQSERAPPSRGDPGPGVQAD